MMNVLSLGAGVQSSTMALMAAHGEFDVMPDAAIFADTQAEPKEVYEWLDWLEKQLPFPVHRVVEGNLKDDSMEIRLSKKSGKNYIKHLIPFFIKNADPKKRDGILMRKCTADYKLKPIFKKAKELAGVPRACKEVKVISWIGISRDEAQRMKPSREKWAENRFPLIEKSMYRGQCIEWMKANGYPEPPRSACTFCPYHSNNEWRRLNNNDFQKAVEFEKTIQKLVVEKDGALNGTPFLHSSMIPLGEVDLSDESKKQPDMFNNECEGMCGV